MKNEKQKLKRRLPNLKQIRLELKRMERVDLKDKDAPPFHLHIGMRTAKTVLAVMICGWMGWVLQEPPLFAMFSAVLCMQSSTDDTVKNGFNRVLGTVLGGTFSVTMLAICDTLSIQEETLLYYMMIAGMMIPIIATTLYIRKPTISALSCVVFIAVCLSPIDGMSPFLQAGQRTMDTLAGIIVTMCIELIFPYHPNFSREEEVLDQITMEGWEK